MISDNLVQVASYSYPHEAHIARASLDAAGIPAFIADEHTINMQWLYSDALGGVRLLVPREYAEDAAMILDTDFSDELEEQLGVEEVACPVCGSTNVEAYTIGKKPAFIVFLLLGFPLFFYRHGIKCRDCGKVSKVK